MQGILIVAHGSRSKTCQEVMHLIVNELRISIAADNADDITNIENSIPNIDIELCFLEFNKPNIADGLEKLITNNIKQIKVIPYFLFDGVHTKKTIADEINNYFQQNPQHNHDVTINIASAIGYDSRLIAILKDKIKG